MLNGRQFPFNTNSTLPTTLGKVFALILIFCGTKSDKLIVSPSVITPTSSSVSAFTRTKLTTA